MTPAVAFQELLAALDRLGIPYLVSGSVASSVHGVARATRNIDVLVEMRDSQAGPLASALSGNFYGDAGCQVASPEDSILSKLVWYRSGGEVSDQQWRDVLGVVKMQGAQLDLEYLRKWAAQLRVDDLLDRVLND